MDAATLERLLREGEGTTLDYKRDPYPFNGASDHEKSELLKDILAFANAWRRTDSYILVGVEEHPGAAVVHGVTSHPDDAQLQQFVNSKTATPVDFSYTVFEYAGKQVGILHVPLQTRPVFLTRDFGKLRANVVYLRRSSSTDTADPTEVARMGREDTGGKAPTPRLELAIFYGRERERLGTRASLRSTVYEMLGREQLLYPAPPSHYSMSSIHNENYLVELNDYLYHRGLLQPVRIGLRNVGERSAEDVHVELEGSHGKDLFVLDASEFPAVPKDTLLADPPSFGYRQPPDLTVTGVHGEWWLRADFGRLKPGEDAVTSSEFYVGATRTQEVSLSAVIYAHDAAPVTVPVVFDITAQPKALTAEDFRPFLHR